MFEKVYVIHVSKGYEDREQHINKHLAEQGIAFEYILDGDISDLSEEIVSQTFVGRATRNPAVMSCAYKHFLAYEALLASNASWALVLEDDIFLKSNFTKTLRNYLIRTPLPGDRPVLFNLEGANRYVPWIRKKRGVHVYRAGHTKLAGAYLINRLAAQTYLAYIKEHKCAYPLDHFQTKIGQATGVQFYWAEPFLACQGSKNGAFASELSHRRKTRFRWISDFARKLSGGYQKYIVTNVSPKRYREFTAYKR